MLHKRCKKHLSDVFESNFTLACEKASSSFVRCKHLLPTLRANALVLYEPKNKHPCFSNLIKCNILTHFTMDRCTLSDSHGHMAKRAAFRPLQNHLSKCNMCRMDLQLWTCESGAFLTLNGEVDVVDCDGDLGHTDKSSKKDINFQAKYFNTIVCPRMIKVSEAKW